MHHCSTCTSQDRLGPLGKEAAKTTHNKVLTCVPQPRVDTLHPVQLARLQETKNSCKDFLLQQTSNPLLYRMHSVGTFDAVGKHCSIHWAKF